MREDLLRFADFSAAELSDEDKSPSSETGCGRFRLAAEFDFPIPRKTASDAEEGGEGELGDS